GWGGSVPSGTRTRCRSVRTKVDADGLRSAPGHQRAVGRPGAAVRPAHRPDLLLHVLPEDGFIGDRPRRREPSGNEGVDRPRRRPRTHRVRGRRPGGVGLAGTAGGVREAPPVPDHETGGRSAGVVHRVLLRGPRGPGPWPPGGPAWPASRRGPG